MIEIYLDSAKIDDIKEGVNIPYVKGFTTNPSLMKAAGVTNYEQFAQSTIRWLSEDRPDTTLSLEVFADDHKTMVYQAMKIHERAKKFNYTTYVKIPITNTQGVPTASIVSSLNHFGIPVNVTAIFTPEQTEQIFSELSFEIMTPLILSVFSGRISDTGVDAKENFSKHVAKNIFGGNVKFLWASCRQPYSYIEAMEVGADIITMSLDQIKKRDNLFGKDLNEYSLETVTQFYKDAKNSGYTIA